MLRLLNRCTCDFTNTQARKSKWLVFGSYFINSSFSNFSGQYFPNPTHPVVATSAMHHPRYGITTNSSSSSTHQPQVYTSKRRVCCMLISILRLCLVCGIGTVLREMFLLSWNANIRCFLSFQPGVHAISSEYILQSPSTHRRAGASSSNGKYTGRPFHFSYL